MPSLICIKPSPASRSKSSIRVRATSTMGSRTLSYPPATRTDDLPPPQPVEHPRQPRPPRLHQGGLEPVGAGAFGRQQLGPLLPLVIERRPQLGDQRVLRGYLP